MHKLATAALAILVLFLLAANSRLETRRAALEHRLAAAERRPRPAMTASPVAPEPPPAEPPPAPVVAPPPAVQPRKTEPTLSAVTPALVPTNGNMTFWLKSGVPEADLGLTPAVKAAIAELRRMRTEQVQDIEDRTEAAIRTLLTSEQREKYDSQGRLREVELAVAQEAATPQAGPKPGYLGVSGSDSAGGGVELQQVFPDTVASRAGLQSGDVLLDIDGEKLAGYAALAEKIRAAGEGRPMSLRLRRAGAEFTLGVQLGPRP